MKTKLFLVLGTAVALMGLVGGVTLALFTDSVKEETTYKAGTLCLSSDRDDGDRIPGPMFYVTPEQGKTPSGLLGVRPTGLWLPGDAHISTLIVHNKEELPCLSSMDAWLDSVQAKAHAGGYEDLSDKMTVTITTTRAGGAELFEVAKAPLRTFLNGPVPLRYPDGTKVPSYLASEQALHFTVKMDLDTNNDYQDKTLIVDFTVNATQMDHNP